MAQQQQSFFRFFALLFAACSGLWSGKLFAHSEGVNVSYSLDSSTTTMHEPVIVRLEVFDDSKEPIMVIAVVKQSPAWPPNADTMAGTRATLAWQALHRIATSTSNVRLRQEIQRTVP